MTTFCPEMESQLPPPPRVNSLAPTKKPNDGISQLQLLPSDELTSDDSGPTSATRLKFMHAQIIDSSIPSNADDTEDAILGTIANSLCISLSNESARVENAITVGEMDLAIKSLQQWKLEHAASLRTFHSFADNDEATATETKRTNEIMKALQDELDGYADIDEVSRCTTHTSYPTSSTPYTYPSSSIPLKIDLSRLQQQQTALAKHSLPPIEGVEGVYGEVEGYREVEEGLYREGVEVELGVAELVGRLREWEGELDALVGRGGREG